MTLYSGQHWGSVCPRQDRCDRGRRLQYESLRNERPAAGAPGVAASGASAARRPGHGTPSHNLPLRLTSFVGREREIADVAALVQRERLVTVVGAPGVGKTRLSLQIARGALEAFPDGAWLVELAPLSDLELVPRAVADALGVREQPGRSLTSSVAGYLRTRHLLLLLDNCEHLIQAAATLVESLLQTCPGLHVLATSRELLAIEGEVTHRVQPLLDGEAARLFVDRARIAAPGFVLTERTSPIVGQICARLDGIPLAIELAAARVRALSPEQIAARLDDRFRLLTGGSRTALPRQQTLRGAVEWSHDLLAPSEQALLRRLAVFAGGFTLDAASWVLGDPESDVVDLLASLVDKSLVQLDEASDLDGERRYRLLETLRDYGLEKLAQYEELSSARGRHLDYFLAFVEEAEPHLTGSAAAAALARLAREHDNLRAALAWCQHEAVSACEAGDASPASAVWLRLATALWVFWRVHGHYGEGRRWLEQALAAQQIRSRPADLVLRARAHWGLAQLVASQGAYHLAVRQIELGLALARESSDERGIAYALSRLGYFRSHLGAWDQARQECAEGVTTARRLADRHLLADVLSAAAMVAWISGQVVQNLTLSQEAVTIWRELGRSGPTAASVQRSLSRAHYALGERDRAHALAEEALDFSRRIGEKHGIGESFKDLGYFALLDGDPDRAIEMFRRGIETYQETGGRWMISVCCYGLAGASLARGARASHRQTGAAAQAPAAPEHLLHAARLYAAADMLREDGGNAPPPDLRGAYDRDIATLRTSLGEAVFEQAYADGRTLSFEQVVEYALSICAPDSTGAPDVPVGGVTGARSPGDPVPGDPEMSRLTPREREVAVLVARGLTNRQMAASLVLSERTVDSHVRSILSKLALTSRAQIAARVVESGLGRDR